MEDNNDMSSASTLETQPIGGTGGEVLAICGDCNDITQGGPPKTKYKTKYPIFLLPV